MFVTIPLAVNNVAVRAALSSPSKSPFLSVRRTENVFKRIFKICSYFLYVQRNQNHTGMPGLKELSVKEGNNEKY